MKSSACCCRLRLACLQDTPWEIFLESLAYHPERQSNMDAFFADAASGNLPAFAWINPRSGINVTTGQGSNDQVGLWVVGGGWWVVGGGWWVVGGGWWVVGCCCFVLLGG